MLNPGTWSHPHGDGRVFTHPANSPCDEGRELACGYDLNEGDFCQLEPGHEGPHDTRRSMTMPVTDTRPEWLAYAMANPDVAPDPPICVIHGPRPVVAGLPDHPGTSGWGKVQCLDGSWLSCIRCGDCRAVLLIDNEMSAPRFAAEQTPQPAMVPFDRWDGEHRCNQEFFLGGTYKVRCILALDHPKGHRAEVAWGAAGGGSE